MESDQSSPSYMSHKWWLILAFDIAKRFAWGVLVDRYGIQFAREVSEEARREFYSLIPQIPYIGGRQNPLTPILISSAMFLALYKAMKKRGMAVDDVGSVVNESVDRFYRLFPRSLLRMHGGRSFTERSFSIGQKNASISAQRQYPGGWVYSMVAGEGEAFDYGMDFEECGICKFFRIHDASEFVPYLCELDFLLSGYYGWGLIRTTTIANGDDRCDFRYRRAG